MTDIWSRALSYHFLSGLGVANTLDTITTAENFFTNDTSHGAGILWSDMKNVPTFQRREFPLPIVVANVRPPGFTELPPDTVLFLNSTQYEFTPWEMGSYDPDLSAFVDVRFMGTHLINGQPPNSSACVTQFDQTSFVFGTSSSLFNVRICTPTYAIRNTDSLSSKSSMGLMISSQILTKTTAMRYSTFSGECWKRYRPVLTTLPTIPMCVLPLASLGCALNLPLSHFKVSIPAFSRMLNRNGSSLSMVLRIKRTSLSVLYLSKLDTSMLSSPLMEVLMT